MSPVVLGGIRGMGVFVAFVSHTYKQMGTEINTDVCFTWVSTHASMHFLALSTGKD